VALRADIAMLSEIQTAPVEENVIGISLQAVEGARREFASNPSELKRLRAELQVRLVVCAHRIFEWQELIQQPIFQRFHAPLGVTSFVVAQLTTPDGTHPRHLWFGRAGGPRYTERDEEPLMNVVRTIALADSSLRPRAEALPDAPAFCGPFRSGLTARQEEICIYLVHGYTNPEIAKTCGISCHTVRNHLVRLFAKFDVSNRTELATRLGSRQAPTDASR
jgi:DNA-binding CsgD family transcriptional regulator